MQNSKIWTNAKKKLRHILSASFPPFFTCAFSPLASICYRGRQSRLAAAVPVALWAFTANLQVSARSFAALKRGGGYHGVAGYWVGSYSVRREISCLLGSNSVKPPFLPFYKDFYWHDNLSDTGESTNWIVVGLLKLKMLSPSCKNQRAIKSEVSADDALKRDICGLNWRETYCRSWKLHLANVLAAV